MSATSIKRDRHRTEAMRTSPNAHASTAALRRKVPVMQPQDFNAKKNAKDSITVAELAAAFYDAAFAELKDERLAHQVSTDMMVDYLGRMRG